MSIDYFIRVKLLHTSWVDERTGYGRIARYAWGEDYHRIFKKRLHDLEQSIHQLVPGAHTTKLC